nr:FeoB-associated Cys-rich membrane protein [Tenacibaculum skagerrakense]
MIQQIITYAIIVLAFLFLGKKFFYTPKKKKGCDTNCGCG